MNILSLLTPKTTLAYLDDSMSVRQAFEKFRAHRYTAIPLIAKEDGRYLGTIKEGDFLYHIIDHSYLNVKELEGIKITDLLQKEYMPAVSVSASFEEVLDMVVSQNFVPIVDDRGTLMGIITRKSIINYLKETSA